MQHHVLASKLNSVLTDNKFDRFVGNKKRGNLDFSNLAKISYSDKVFMQREARKNKDYKLIVLADASGSMRGSPQAYCAEALELLNQALSKVDIEYSLWAFNQEVMCLQDFGQKYKEKEVYNKYYDQFERQSIVCPHCSVISYISRQDYNDKIYNDYINDKPSKCPSCSGDIIEAFYNVSSVANGTFDGMALHLAQERLEKLPGNHIIIILSDGEADSINFKYREAHYLQKGGIRPIDFPAKQVANKIVKKGTLLCSVGIKSELVHKVYPKENTRVIYDPKKTGTAIVSILNKLIKRG